METTDMARMERAWSVVKPPTDWRAEIDVTFSDLMLSAAEVTIDDVVRAVAHYTACAVRLERVTAYVKHRDGLVQFPTTGYSVRALGYRNGPAGP